jgi:hypothetical protein
MASEYYFITDWQFKARVEEVRAILDDATELPRWWPAVYIQAERVRPGDARHIGETIRLFTKGYLPYTLRWEITITDSDPLTLDSTGDFVGRAIWTFVQQGDTTLVKIDWKITVEKPILKRLTFLLRPVFTYNHHWAMEMGERSIELELARRRAKNDAERQAVPPPPPPTPTSVLEWLMMPFRKR